MTDEQLESFAIRAAPGNNGGEWATHYTEGQKEHWRQFVKDLVADILKTQECQFCAVPDPAYHYGATCVPSVPWCMTHKSFQCGKVPAQQGCS